MTGPTKILTVSYGTFSCTLEGFDDPLGSMREMAEYFRDLAADDRYFGAEPPTPDVEMLQRIAEKEVQRRVEARVTETGVALVAAEPSKAHTASAPQTNTVPPQAQEPEPAPTERPVAAAAPPNQQPTFDPDAGPLAVDDEYLMADEPDDFMLADPNARLGETGPAESVAEKLRRIRAVVSQNIAVDPMVARREQAPNAENPDLRDRALSATINQIQADLADDEDAPASKREPADEDNPDPEPVETSCDSSEAGDGSGLSDASTEEPAVEPPEAQLDAAEETNPVATTAIDEGSDVDPYVFDDVEEVDDAQHHHPARDAASVSQMIGSVTERLKAEAAEETGDVPFSGPRTATRLLSPEPEDDVGRLLTETDSKLNDDETVRRRRVISQMRAAVAATKADRMVSSQVISREAQEEAEQDPYREDLSEAVEVSEAVTEIVQPETSRKPSTPPLVLVSSQRIDGETEAENSNAAEFAAKFGAKELPELMEAAAAYAIFSEGQPSFTRPEIMQMVTRMDPSLTLSREESLRSFGQLLRDGTFKKLERGQFTIDQATKYNPEAIAAGL
ncbi:MAG: hypothetical protein AAF222_08475 [Pseudomonadota bacterium]